MSERSSSRVEVREVWSSIPAPPADDLKLMSWGWGEAAARAFTGIAPMDVDITSAGFYAATPLLDLPSRVAAAYLGTYLLALLQSLDWQERTGDYPDAVTRAHVLTCLVRPTFWERVVRPVLPRRCREVLLRVVEHLVAQRDALPLTEEKASRMAALASEGVAD